MTKSPWPTQLEVTKFYGNPGDMTKNLVTVAFPFPVYFGHYLVRTCQIHKLCSSSLTTVLNNVAKEYGYDAGDISNASLYAISRMHNDGVSIYDGTYAMRNMRGAHSLSMHAFGCAIDFDATHNPRGHAGRFTCDSILVRAFEAEGWVWGGRWSRTSCDPMHFQAAKVR